MVHIGIGEYAISKTENEVLMTYSLGSCVAFIIRCPYTKLTAMAHVVLPETLKNNYQPENLSAKPAYYADQIIPELIQLFSESAFCNKGQLQIAIIGGAISKNNQDLFKVGLRNVEKIQDYMTFYSLKPKHVDVGGYVSRTVSVSVSTGEVITKNQNMVL